MDTFISFHVRSILHFQLATCFKVFKQKMCLSVLSFKIFVVLATENTWTWTILHVCVLKVIKYAELQCLKNAVLTFIIAKWAYKSTISTMSIIPVAKPKVHFKMTSLDLMEWCLSLFSVVYILCVRPPSDQRGASSQCFISVSWAEVKHWFPDEFRGHLLCLMSSESAEISSHWEQSCTPTLPASPPPLQSWNMVISHSCCVKLVFLCGCDKHMVFCEERSLKTHNRDGSCFYPYVMKISNYPT